MNYAITTSFPSVTSDPLTLNVKQFICDLANAVGNTVDTGTAAISAIANSNTLSGTSGNTSSGNTSGGNTSGGWDGWIRNNPIEVPTYPVDPNLFASSGDPRHSLGESLKMAFNHFLPLIETYKQAASVGGCQIVNGFICDADGNQIAETTVNCPVSLSAIKPQMIIDTVNQNHAIAIKKQADSFISHIQTNYVNNGWNVQPFEIPEANIFFIKATKAGQQNVFKKYFYDQKDYVASQLGKSTHNYDGSGFLVGEIDNQTLQLAASSGQGFTYIPITMTDDSKLFMNAIRSQNMIF